MSDSRKDLWPRWSQAAPQMLGASVAFLGAIVLIHWYLDTLQLMTLPSAWVPMQQSTAMGFLFTGLAVVAHCMGRRRLSFLCGVAAAGIGSVALAEPVLGGRQSVAPGMSPATALCFSLAGCLILVRSMPRISTRWRSLVTGVLSAMLSAAGLVGLLNLAMSQGDGGYTRFTAMDLHSALAFLGLGVAFFMMLGHFGSDWGRNGLPRWAPWGAGVVVGVLILGVWKGLVSTEQRIHDMNVDMTQRSVAAHAEDAFLRHLGLLEQVSRLITFGASLGRQELDESVDALLGEIPSLRGVAWVDGRGQPLYRRGPASASPGWPQRMLAADELQHALERSQDAQGLTATDPFWESPLTSSIVVCVPVERAGERIGTLLFQHGTQAFFSTIFEDDGTRPFGVELYTMDDEPFYRSYGAARSRRAAGGEDVAWLDHLAFGDRLWKLRGVPNPLWLASDRSMSNTLILWVGVFLAVAVAFVVRKSELLRERAQSLETARRTIEQKNESMREAKESLEEQTQHLLATEERLRRAAREKRRVLDSLSAFLIGCDGEGHVTEWNAVSSQLFGLDADQTRGRKLEELDIPWNRKVMRRAIAECVERDARVVRDDLVLTVVDDEGEEQSRLLGFTINPTLEGSGYSIIGSDITERQMLEMQLHHAQKLESVGTLAAGIAHEINTPMQFVNDNVRFLSQSVGPITEVLKQVPGLVKSAQQAGVPDDQTAPVSTLLDGMDIEFVAEEMPMALDETLEGIDRVTTIVRAMKEFSHPGKDGVAAADINKALETTLHVARNEYKYHATVETDFGDLPQVECWIADLNQVFLNLLVNGTHAIRDRNGNSGEMGTITISTRALGEEHVEIRFHDTGCGIPEESREKIFDQFYTTKEVGRGTGLGLAIARQVVVDKHGGRIHFETELDVGTTFIVQVPVKQEVVDVVEPQEAHPVR